jgi:hypothetical protein
VTTALAADLRAAESNLDDAHATRRAQASPGQKVLDIRARLISRAIGIAAFITAGALARDSTFHTGYALADHQAHALIRHALTGSGDIDHHDGVLTIRLDPTNTASHHRHRTVVVR